MVASPPPAPPPPTSSTGGGLARRSIELSTMIKVSLQQPGRPEADTDSLATSGGWLGRQAPRARQRQSRPAAETFVLQASSPPDRGCYEPRPEEAGGAVQLIAKLFDSTVFGGRLPAQEQQQQQQQQQPVLPVPIAVLPPALPPLSLRLLPLQRTLCPPQLALPTRQQQQQQQQQQQRRTPAVDPQLAQQALRVLEETPQALMLGPSVAALGSSPMLTPLALMLMDHGSSQPAPAASLEPGMAAGGCWPPVLAAAGSVGGAVSNAGAAAQTPCTALLSALLADGPPADDAESAKLEDMLRRGDFSIESLLGSLPATPALAAAAVGPTLPVPAGHKRPTAGNLLDPALAGSPERTAAPTAAGAAGGPTPAAAFLDPLLAPPLAAAAPGVFMKPQLLSQSAWALLPSQHVPDPARQAQQPVPATPAGELQRTPPAGPLGPGGLLARGLCSPSQGLMSPSAVADWLT